MNALSASARQQQISVESSSTRWGLEWRHETAASKMGRFEEEIFFCI